MPGQTMQQKTIQQQQKNQQQKTDTAISTNTVIAQKEKQNGSFDKMLRHPRSKKKMKMYASVDMPSMRDKEIMEMMLKDQSMHKAEEIMQEDIAAFLQSYQEEFIKMVQNEIKEEEERVHKEEEARKIKEMWKANRKIGVLAKCYITGCHVHFIPCASTSWNNVSHYERWNVPEQYQRALNLYESNNKCDAVEIYGSRLVALASNGEVIKIEKVDFDD